MFAHKFFDVASKLPKASYSSFKVVYPRTPTTSRSGELTLSGVQLLVYFGIALATFSLLIWTGVHYMIFAP